MNYIFFSKSSGTEPYQVVFNFTGNLLTVTCNCQAGVFGKLCKHKLALLHGDENMLFDMMEAQKLREVSQLVQNTTYPQLLIEIQQAELEMVKAKRIADQRKRNLEKAFQEGA